MHTSLYLLGLACLCETSSRPTRRRGPTFRHNVTSVEERFTGADIAEATSQIFARTSQSTCDHLGEWRDKLVGSEDGTCLIEEKAIVLNGWDPEDCYAKVVGGK